MLVPAPPSTVDFRTAIGDRVISRAGNDVIRAAIAVDDVVAGTRRDVVPAGRAGNGHTGSHGAGVEVFEIRHRDGVAGGLVDPRRDAEIHRRDSAAGRENERIGSCARVDRYFGTAVGDSVVARAGADDIGSAAAIDGVDATAGRDVVGRRGTRHRQAVADRAGIQVLEIQHGDAVAAGDVGARRRGQVDARKTRDRANDQGIVAGATVDGDFRSPIVDRVVTGAGNDGVGAGITLDDVIA